MSSPMAVPVAPTRRALISTSAPAPEPRSSTVSPSCRSATAVGTPQPSDAPSADSVAPSTSSREYRLLPKTPLSSATDPQQDAPSLAARAAAAYFSRTVSRMSSLWPAAQPQLPPAALVPQHASFSDGSQHDACISVEQQNEVGSGVVSSAMRSAPSARRGMRSSR